MASTAPQTAERMTEAATDFLEALDDDQRALAMLPFDDEAERQTWHYTPIERCGLTLNEMRPQQRRLAMRLMGSGLSMGGFVTASTIIGLEATLEGLDGWPSRAYAETRPSVPFRDPGMYYAAVFGEPGGEAAWGWRIGGHHVALQYTIAGGHIVSPTPTFFGAHPGRGAAGRRALATPPRGRGGPRARAAARARRGAARLRRDLARRAHRHRAVEPPSRARRRLQHPAPPS